MRGPVLLGVTALVLAIDGRGAAAQTIQGSEKVRVSINVGGQLSSTTFTTAATSTVFLEPSTINTSYTVPKGKLFDGGILFRVAGNFGVGVALSWFSERHDAPVTGLIPNPFGFNSPPSLSRPLSGTAAGLQRSEFDAHIQAAYMIATKRYDVVISGGPTIFRVSQDLVSNAVYSDTYPFDTVTFRSATTVKGEGTKTGFNAGVDFGYRIASNSGVGGLVRFSRASVSFPLTGSATSLPTQAASRSVAAFDSSSRPAWQATDAVRRLP
jgi:hypothetical protein